MLQLERSLSSFVAPVVVPLSLAGSLARPSASLAVSFAGGWYSRAVSVKAASFVLGRLPTRTKYEAPRRVTNATCAVLPAATAEQSSSSSVPAVA